MIELCCEYLPDMTRTYSQMHRTDKYSEHSSIIDQFGQMVECLFTNEVVLGSSPVAVKELLARLLRARSSLTFRQLWNVDSFGDAYVT